MKRLCFDTESNYFKRGGTGIGSPEDHREYFRQNKTRFTFHCAVVFDEETGKFQEFSDKQANELIAAISLADELISHSGTRVDLIVLEHACGEESVAPLWVFCRKFDQSIRAGDIARLGATEKRALGAGR